MDHKPVQDTLLAQKTAPRRLFALKTHFALDARRLDFIARFITALFQIRSVQLPQIALALGSKAKLESNIRRVRRFLDFDFSQDLIARFVLSFVPDEKLVLYMDCFLPLTPAPSCR